MLALSFFLASIFRVMRANATEMIYTIDSNLAFGFDDGMLLLLLLNSVLDVVCTLIAYRSASSAIVDVHKVQTDINLHLVNGFFIVADVINTLDIFFSLHMSQESSISTQASYFVSTILEERKKK